MPPPPPSRTGADVKALHAAVRERRFAPAYYFYGDDDYLKEDDVRRVIDAAVDPATRDFNFETLRGADVDAETLGSIVSTPPMMAERRVVVINDVNALKKDSRAMLDRYLKAPSPDLLLLLVAPSVGASGGKADKQLSGATVAVEFKPLTGDRIPKWIAHYAQHEHGLTITGGGVELLQKAVGTDLAQLKIELDKLASFAGGGPIDEAAVSAVVGVRPGETMGDFLDAVARRDAMSAVAVLAVVLEQPKANAVTMLMALTAQTLAIGWAQAARERSGVKDPSRLSRDLFDVLKAAGSVFTGRSWGSFVATCVHASELWTPRSIDGALETLLEADAMLKTTRLSSDEQVMSNVALVLCGAAPRRRAA